MFIKPEERNLRFLMIFGFLSICLAISTFAQKYRIDRWTTDEGLPQNSGNGLIQSRDGYIWAIACCGFVAFLIIAVAAVVTTVFYSGISQLRKFTDALTHYSRRLIKLDLLRN